MKIKKAGKILFSIIGGLLLTVLLVVLFWLGPTVSFVAQKVGIKALGTPLSIDKLSINPRKGTIHLSDFAIANHHTFSKSNAVSLASMDIAIDMSSLFSSTVVVHQVEINSPHFIYEQSSASDNITEFIQNIQEFVGFDPDAPPVEKKKKPKKKKKAKKEPKVVVVESLEINDVQFNFSHTDDNDLDIVLGFEQLAVSMTNGTVELNEVYVRNPGRLSTPNLFTLDQVSVLLEPESIYSSNITINAIQVSNPQAYLEHNRETDTIGEFLKIADSAISSLPPPKAPATNTGEVVEEDEDPAPPPPEVILESLAIEGIRVHVVNIGDPKLNVHFGIDAIKAALSDGRVTVDNIHITNPERLATPNLFALDAIRVDFAPESLKADTFVIEDVQVLKPYAFLELNKEANTTGEFMKIANGFISRVPTYPTLELPPAQEAAPEPEPPVTESSDAPPPFELHNLLVDDIEVRLLDTTPTNDVPTESSMIAGIGSISIKLVEGKLQINGISVPNAKGFAATNLFHLANIDIAIDPDSIHSDQVVINQVFVNSPEVNLEQTEDSGNAATLQSILMQFIPPASKDAETAVAKEAAAKAVDDEKADPVPLAEQPVVLHQLIVTNLAVNLKLPASTNAPAMRFDSLNPVDKLSMDKLSLNKLNPLAGDQSNDEVVDPDAPMELVSFDRLSLEPLKGMLDIDGLRISNPPGFTKRDLVNIEEFRIDLDPDTLQADTLLIEDILITKPRIRYERQIMSDNIKALQKEIEQAVARRGEYTDNDAEDQKATEESISNEEEGQKVIIEHVLIASGMVRAKLSALPSIPVPLPNIELNDIGKEEGGASVEDASTKVFDTFYDSMIGAVGGATGFGGDLLKGAGSLVGDMAGGVKDGIGTAAGATGTAVKDTVENIKKKRSKRRGAGGRRRFL
jgi:uncharacterized protein involved in outer membrane biogenesis